MEQEKKKIVYHGIKEVTSGRVMFVEKLMQYNDRCMERMEQETYLKKTSKNQEIKNWQISQNNQKLRKENEQLKLQVKHLRKICDEQVDILQKQEAAMIRKREEIERYKVKETLQHQELSALRTYVHSLADNEEQEYEAQCYEKNNLRKRQQLIEKWKRKKVLVIGGHRNWQNKLREFFPEWQFVACEKKNMDKEIVRGKECIICNTEILTHSCYYKAMASRKKGQKIYYVHSNNIDMCIQELQEQGFV